MPELPIEQTVDPAELETLRKVNAELVAKRARDKARITELETGTMTLQSQLTEASESLHQVTIGGPLKAMAESMSNAPDLFLEQFSKHFRVEMVKGSLTLLLADGTPAIGKDKKPIPFERQALTELLTTGDDARAKTFKTITFASRASGGASIGTHNRTSQTKVAKPEFGLR